MKRGIGTQGYEGYIIELKVHYPESQTGAFHTARGRVEEAVVLVIPNQSFGTWEAGEGANWQWRYLTAGPVGWKPEELYWRVCKAIWKAAGYRWVLFEARPIKVRKGWYAASEPEDFKETQ